MNDWFERDLDQGSIRPWPDHDDPPSDNGENYRYPWEMYQDGYLPFPETSTTDPLECGFEYNEDGSMVFLPWVENITESGYEYKDGELVPISYITDLCLG